MKKESVHVLILLSVFAVFIIISRAYFFGLPLDRDEGAYAYTAWEANHGAVIYKDVFDHKPPLVYLIYQAAFLFFGYDLVAVRAMAALYTVLSMLALYFAVKAYSGRKAALISAFLYSIFQASVMMQSINANSELFTHLPAALALYFFSKNSKTAGVMTGVMCAAAVLAKPFFILLMPAFFLISFFADKQRLKAVLIFAGFITVNAAVYLFFALKGAGSDYIKCVILFNIKYSGLIMQPAWPGKGTHALFFREMAGAILLFGIGLVNGFKDRKYLVVSVFLLAAVIPPVFILKSAYAHYFVTFIPGLCAAAGLSAANLLVKHRGISAAAVILTVSLPVIQNYPFYSMPMDKVTVIQNNTSRYQETAIIGEFIGRVRKGTDTLFVWQAEPQIYFYAKMKAPLGIPYFFINDSILRPEDGDRLLREISGNPRNFMVLERDQNPEGMDSFIASGYTKIMATKHFDVYYANIAK